MSNLQKSSHKQTATAKVLASSKTWNATQKGSCSRPPNPSKHQHTSKKKAFKCVWKGKAPAPPVHIEEVHDLATTGSEIKVVEYDSSTEDSDNGKDE
ncbi:hypothetical protein AZE42_11714 [Rhizopogon vesiculosus]|uniref:Uncharacterized protein n=1 Tax=Rhizopogon vesiculosus TaxID=180088 RepID=A0A1J8QHG2_9AGAM|nr:hypothetical protein AZE42_11714 [Rhizopogon vesiculosus]